MYLEQTEYGRRVNHDQRHHTYLISWSFDFKVALVLVYAVSLSVQPWAAAGSDDQEPKRHVGWKGEAGRSSNAGEEKEAGWDAKFTASDETPDWNISASAVPVY